MDQFRRASETQDAVTILVPAVSHEGPLQRPTGVPPARAPGPVSHFPTQGRRLVYQDLNDGKIGLCGWLWQIFPQVAEIVLITAHLHFISKLASPALLAPLIHYYK